jgi:hypothetical protein
MRAGVIVAHPDDCVIFAWPLMRKLKQLDWTIIYLTYTEAEPRAQEIKRFWDRHEVKTIFLGYVDDYRDIESGNLSFDAESARLDIQDHCRDFDLLLTHNQDGDYGHPHHKFVNMCVIPCPIPKIYFASTFNNNLEIECKEQYDSSCLPLHQEVIEGFVDRFIGRYCVEKEAMEILGWVD